MCVLRKKLCKSDLECGVNQACESYSKSHNFKKCQYRDYGGVKPKPNVPTNVLYMLLTFLYNVFFLNKQF